MKNNTNKKDIEVEIPPNPIYYKPETLQYRELIDSDEELLLRLKEPSQIKFITERLVESKKKLKMLLDETNGVEEIPHPLSFKPIPIQYREAIARDEELLLTTTNRKQIKLIKNRIADFRANLRHYC